MHNFTVTITNGSYMYQLHSSQQQAVYVSSITVNYIPAVYIVKNVQQMISQPYTQRYTIVTHNQAFTI